MSLVNLLKKILCFRQIHLISVELLLNLFLFGAICLNFCLEFGYNMLLVSTNLVVTLLQLLVKVYLVFSSQLLEFFDVVLLHFFDFWFLFVVFLCSLLILLSRLLFLKDNLFLVEFGDLTDNLRNQQVYLDWLLVQIIVKRHVRNLRKSRANYKLDFLFL